MPLGFVPRKIIIASEILSVEECDLALWNFRGYAECYPILNFIGFFLIKVYGSSKMVLCLQKIRLY